ncbi:MAG: molybdopterin-dependent oxidoreductase [Deltaproteobacteria bacterium]|nr:molybdopterin-dependent oxidoreductase [Deltaproteobacteria bacterium]
MTADWKPTACVLCSINCGLLVQPEGRRIAKIRGDKAHPASRGYLCEKPQRLDYYQSGRDRLSAPLRRRADCSFETIDWATAIREVASKLAAIRDAHGGETIFHYGGGGQGNHLGGAYGRATRAALGSRYTSNALAQEKTGEFWVDGQLFGKPRCHTCPDIEHAEVAVFVGKNPWHSHGFPRARKLLNDIAADPTRTLVVIDPRRTETTEMADFHLQVKPGRDAWLLAAMAEMLIRDDFVDREFLATHGNGFDELTTLLGEIDISRYLAIAGVEASLVETVVRRISGAASVSVLEDLGIQQAPHSTLGSWLEKLLYLLTGNFAKRGAMNIHSRFASLGGGGGAKTAGSPVGGHRLIGGLVPCNVIPDEILTDHPARFRAMIVESANPAHSLADSPRMREALGALECLVVIDVAMTETARLAHYVLPVSSQYEKWECTFFNLEFPENVFHLRRPVFDPLPGTLTEGEIHTRLVRHLGVLDGLPLDELRAAAKNGLADFGMAFLGATMQNPTIMNLAPVVLRETLGSALPEGATDAAVIWGLAQTCAQTYPDAVRRAGVAGDDPLELGNALFRAVMDAPSGLIFTVDEPDATWQRVETPDRRIRLVVPELVDELRSLATEDPSAADGEFPFILAAGERRGSTANTVYRDPDWRREDREGALRVSPEDASRLGLADGARAAIVTKRGRAVAVVRISDTLRPGHITLPNGQGLMFDDGTHVGVAPNELTSGADRDPIAGTPWHKHVHARIEPIAP